ncbi:MAG: response regulator [Lachnospiraceae bacterium]|nr:response regulator [Lachnospiraceae bacterium]
MARELCELIEWENIGYCVVGQASNGLQAMEMTARLHPDILIMDVHLPEYNGIEVLRRVRVFRPHLPVILISSSAEFIYAQQALRYGAQDILVRPIERADILRCLYQIDCSSGPINRPAAVGEKQIALWSSRLSRSAKFADGVRKLILCANTHLALEEKNCLLFQDGPQWIWAAAVEEEEELSFSGQLEQYSSPRWPQRRLFLLSGPENSSASSPNRRLPILGTGACGCARVRQHELRGASALEPALGTAASMQFAAV